MVRALWRQSAGTVTPGGTFLIALLAAAPAIAAKPPAVRVAAIRWPGADGRVLHGMMAIPAKARGRQPAVLVLAQGTMPQGFAWHAAERLAASGLVVCALDATTPDAAADTDATLRWLATNRYASGKVGLVGIGAAAASAGRVAMERPEAIAALALIDDPTPDATAPPDTPPTIEVASRTSGDPLAARDEAIDRAGTFLKGYLR